MRVSSLLMIIAMCCSVSTACADNWTHWRGHHGNGISETARPPVTWSDTKNVKWKVQVPGQGSGSPIIWEDKVYVVSGVPVADSVASTQQSGRPGRSGFRGRGNNANQLPTLEFTLFCYARETGELLWKQVAVTAKPHEQTHSTNNFASASPCTDGQHIYAHFGSRGLYCYTMDGSLVWKRDDLGRMQARNGFGEGSSPVLAGEKIVVPWDHEGQSAIFALDKRTGETIWKTDREEPTCWATPLIIEHAGAKQVIMNGQNYARSYDLETGRELWRCGGQTQRPVASAVAADGIVYIGSGHRGSFLAAFRPDGSGDVQGTPSVLWTVSKDTPDIASPLLSNGRLYYYKGKAGVVTCLNAATGKPHYGATRVPGLDAIYASPFAAGGHVYLTGRNGTTVVIRDSNNFEVVATNSVGETVDATPAPVDDQLFIRGERHLFCIAEK